MKKLLWLLAVAAVGMYVAPLAYAADDCCWDWSPNEPGKDDREPGDPQKEEPIDMNTIWAACVSRVTLPRPNGSPCFQRNGRQMIWPNWQCLIGSQAPDGTVPPPGAGFLCAEKGGGGGGPGALAKGGDSPPPPDGPSPGTPVEEGKGPKLDVPTLSTTGMVIMMILLVVAAGWMLRRKGSAPSPAA